jgi:hypothetical protein
MARRSYFLCAELSIPRINRLLRPLRNKCAILATCTTSSQSNSAAPVTITYGSTSSNLSRGPPFLDILRDPKLVISHALLESKSLDVLARQIYAVTDAYRNVVQAALTSDLDGSPRGVLSLADMCAATVGRHLQAEVVKGLAALDGEIDEALEMSLSGELYESVPMHYRRYDAYFRCLMNVIVNTSYLQVDPRRTCDVGGHRHLPQSSVSHAQSPRCCVVPWTSN